MGRSRSKTRSRTAPNRRLRSVHSSSSYSPSAVPYGGYRQLRQRLLTPSPYLSPSQRPTVRFFYGTPSITPSQPSPRRPRPGASNPFLTRLRGQAAAPVSETPRRDEERATMVCVDRQQRREVLHALSKAGKSGQKPPVFNWKSKIHCKRRK